MERLYFKGPKLIQSPSLHILMLSVLKQIHWSSTSSTRAVCEQYKKRGRENLPLDSKPPCQCSWYENVCHLDLRFCSDNSRLFSLITMLAKSVRSTKSEVMMLTPSTPGFWASTQDMMVGRFLEPKRKKVCISKQSITAIIVAPNILLFKFESKPKSWPCKYTQKISTAKVLSFSFIVMSTSLSKI